MKKAYRIAVGGWQHETNTFAPHLANFDAFERPDSWPGLTTGRALFDTMKGLNIPLSGFIATATEQGHELLPLTWCSAEPSGYVTPDAFERIAALFCKQLEAMNQVDAVYLDLHGAMVVKNYEDGEGELLARIRRLAGPSVPIVISLDLHANVTEAMVEQSDAMTIYRTYPHLDMAETGGRAYELLAHILSNGKAHKVLRKIPFLFALPAQCTYFTPCKDIYAQLDSMTQQPSILNIDFATGFPPADIAECGAAVVAYAETAVAAEEAADILYAQVVEAEAEFKSELLDPDSAIQRAMQNKSDKPYVLADVQDNPGAGGTSDTTGILEALVRNKASKAVLAVLYDPEVADRAHREGIGARFECNLGGKSGVADVKPYNATFEVETLGDGCFVFTGEMNLNSQARLGNMACLRVIDDHSDVRVIVGNARSQCLDLAMIRHLDIEPCEQNIIVVKSTVHFRADFDPIAEETLAVIAPGIHPCNLVDLDYKKLRKGIRLEPMGPEHK
jgi:microcystin degradation protein MlrC